MSVTAHGGTTLTQRVWTVVAVTIVGLIGGVALGAVLVASRELFGGRPVPFYLENTAAPWILVAFLVGARAGVIGGRGASSSFAGAAQAVAGAYAGVVALLVSLGVYESVFLFSTDAGRGVQLMPLVRPLWLAVSVATGVAIGATGGWWTSRAGWVWIATGVIGGLVAGEAAALALGGMPHPAFDARLAAVQVGVGLGLAAALPPRRVRAVFVAAAVAAAVVGAEAATGLATRVIWG